MAQKSITEFFERPSGSGKRPAPPDENDTIFGNPLFTPPALIPKKRSRSMKASNSGSGVQTVLDAGQKLIGLVYCKKCDMGYNVDNVNDVKRHNERHNWDKKVSHLKVKPQIIEWLKSNHMLISTNTFDVYRFVYSRDLLKKRRLWIERIVQETANKALGLTEPGNELWDTTQGSKRNVYFVVPHQEKFVACVLVTESVSRGYYEEKEIKLPGLFLGVNRLWTHPSLRRRGLATHLLNSVARRRTEADRNSHYHAVHFAPSATPLPLRVAFNEINLENRKIIESLMRKAASLNPELIFDGIVTYDEEEDTETKT